MYKIEIFINERKHAQVVITSCDTGRVLFDRQTTKQRIKELTKWYEVDYGTTQVSDIITVGSIVYWLTDGKEVI